ncbi:MAG: protease pro-enzyme activation domain-containing protein [Mycobacterium sp.]|uniref:S53 family peptidase n=1 Tax=Mycobacterium sp. TaxID=1785 RepID=UPI003F9BEE59
MATENVATTSSIKERDSEMAKKADKATMVALPGSSHPVPVGSKAVRPTKGQRWLELTVGVRPSKPLPDLSGLDDKLPANRKYMTREQLADQYGSDPKAVKAIEAFAKAHNLVVTRNEPASARMGLAGTVEDVNAAFGVTLFDYTHPTLGDFHARTGPVHIPADMDGAITGVFGLNNHRILRRTFRPARHVAPIMSTPARPWFVPTELGGVYNFPQADASEQCIGLLEFGGGVETPDVTEYFAKIKQTAPNVEVVATDGVSVDPSADPNSTGEVMLDVDVAGALGAGAKIVVYFSTFDEKGLIDCLSTVINDSANDPSVVSMSWGFDENEDFNNEGVIWSSAAITHCNASLLAAAQLGITVCVSTGDDGSEAQMQDGRAHVNFPATSPYVLAVGGTTLHARNDANGATEITEVVWNDGPGSGTGGGVSDVTPVPTWQAGKVVPSVNPGHFAGRAIPDVAANADPSTGYLTMSGGKLQIVGGTSASTPLWASLIARINAANGARTGNFNALLYSNFGPGGVLRDITVGDNDTDGLLGGQYKAGAGWDACTGWGAPDGQKLLAALSGPGSKESA